MSSHAETRRVHIEAVRAFTPEAIARLSWSAEQIQQAQVRQLRKVVAHAQKFSPYFQEKLKGVDASSLTLADLPSLPVLTKADIMENWDRVVTDPRLRLAEVSEHLRRLRSGEETNPYYLDKYYASATGGSSGKRGLFLWDWETFIVTANITYRMEAKSDTGREFTRPKRTAVVCAGSPIHGSNMLFPTSLDPQRETRIFAAGTAISELVAQLNDWQPDRLVGYASIVQELCAEALDGHLKIQLERISTNSEPLMSEARTMAHQAWGINIHDTWGSVEIGVAASEGDSFTGLSLAEDFLIFEAVDDHDQPTTDSSKVDRMLVTKLFGEVMPMIRYEMTDTLILDDSPNPDAPGCRRISGIKGRSDAWFVYRNGIRVHPMIFRDVLGQESHISEYQVRQTAEGARVFVITHGALDVPALTVALRQALSKAGVPGPVMAVEIVTELERHKETHKLVRFVPLPAA